MIFGIESSKELDTDQMLCSHGGSQICMKLHLQPYRQLSMIAKLWGGFV